MLSASAAAAASVTVTVSADAAAAATSHEQGQSKFNCSAAKEVREREQPWSGVFTSEVCNDRV